MSGSLHPIEHPHTDWNSIILNLLPISHDHNGQEELITPISIVNLTNYTSTNSVKLK